MAEGHAEHEAPDLHRGDAAFGGEAMTIEQRIAENDRAVKDAEAALIETSIVGAVQATVLIECYRKAVERAVMYIERGEP